MLSKMRQKLKKIKASTRNYAKGRVLSRQVYGSAYKFVCVCGYMLVCGPQFLALE